MDIEEIRNRSRTTAYSGKDYAQLCVHMSPQLKADFRDYCKKNRIKSSEAIRQFIMGLIYDN